MSEKPPSEKQKIDQPSWSVWRQDDNGNIFLVKGGLTESAALKLSQDLEGEGHKQAYWVKEER